MCERDVVFEGMGALYCECVRHIWAGWCLGWGWSLEGSTVSVRRMVLFTVEHYHYLMDGSAANEITVYLSQPHEFEEFIVVSRQPQQFL